MIEYDIDMETEVQINENSDEFAFTIKEEMEEYSRLSVPSGKESINIDKESGAKARAEEIESNGCVSVEVSAKSSKRGSVILI